MGVAVRASSAVSGVFSPVGIQGVEYEDGDESLTAAVRAARQAGAQFIIAVDVAPRLQDAPPNTSVSQLAREAARRRRIDPELLIADFVIQPDIGFKTSPTAAFFLKAEKAGEISKKMATMHHQKLFHFNSRLGAIDVLRLKITINKIQAKHHARYFTPKHCC